MTPFSSPLSQNPLFFRPPPVNAHTFSPRRRPFAAVHTRDGNAAWAAMEGLFPIGEGFQAPGYVPVGGVTYKLQSPRLGKPGSRSSTRGRQLFAEYASMAEPGPLDLAQQAGPQIASHIEPQGVRFTLSCHACAYIDMHIVRPADCHPTGPADSLAY